MTVPGSIADSTTQGRAARKAVPRSAHGGWAPSATRPDPVGILERQAVSRLPDLVPVRYERMAVSPFTFLRGSSAVMAADLADTPTSGLTVQLCGDAHLSNFGLFASPERTLLFDLNDFDETLPGPWEWDLKRLVASIVVAARGNGWTDDAGRAAALAAAGAYRGAMREFASMGELDIWYARARAKDVVALVEDTTRRRRTKNALRAARRRDNLQAFAKLTKVVDGRHQLVDDPPLLEHVGIGADTIESTAGLLRAYRATLAEDRQHLLDRFRVLDVARKVVGVGSVGTRCFVALLAGRDDHDPLLLQVKQAEPSVLEPHLRPSRYRKHGRRVVVGQRLMQAASDIFLGWLTADDGNHYYWRQLRDMKGSVDIEAITPDELAFYAGICGWTLARAHARTGDRVAIASYLGSSDSFDQAVLAFGLAYADQTELDHRALCAAITSGKITAATA